MESQGFSLFHNAKFGEQLGDFQGVFLKVAAMFVTRRGKFTRSSFKTNFQIASTEILEGNAFIASEFGVLKLLLAEPAAVRLEVEQFNWLGEVGSGIVGF